MTGPRRRDRDEGSVALEAALAFPLVGLLLWGVIGLLAVATDQLVAERVARTAARSVVVRGTAGAAADALPPGGRLLVRRRGRETIVEVEIPGSVAGVGYRATARAVAALEPVLP